MTEAVLLTGTLPVFGFLVVSGSVWEGSPDVLAKRRTAVHWIMAAGLGNAVAFVLVLLAAGETRRLAPPRWSLWAAVWVLLLGAGWSLALRAQILQGLGFYVLLFTMPPLIALILIHTAARSSKQVPTVAHSDR